MNAFFEQLRAFGVGRLTAIFGLAAGVAAAMVYFSGAVGGGSQALLYSALDPAEAASISQALDQSNIRYEIREGGSAIYVDAAQVDEARVRVAAGGPLAGASVGYEIFDRSDSFNQTSFEQNINARRALEGELARTIQSLTVISSARVHINMPERRVFARDQQPATATVTVGTRGTLNGEQIRVIRNIVASGAGLEAGNVAVSDERGRLLAGTDGEDALSVMLDDRRNQVEEQLRRRILDLVEGVVGVGAARVQVTAELNRNHVEERSETYDPNGSVLQSERRNNTQSASRDGGPNAVSASENIPDNAGAEGGESGPFDTSESSDSERTFALSSTIREEIRQAGDIEQLSVAVAVDGVVTTAEDGTTQWTERPQAQIDQITELVRSAMGFTDQGTGARQDQLVVRQFEFARADPLLGTSANSPFSMNKGDIMRVAEIAVMFITALLIIFLVARPLVKSASGAAVAAMDPGLALAGAGAGGAALPEGAVAAALPSPDGSMPSALPGGSDDGIDIAKIDGQVKASSVKKVATIVEQHPEESISILRTWLHES